ncbi:hypothetical protein PsorP6_019124 [Peronosclerospora sorghi]|nr:hypothetical protein PsorP6_019124 [Peronosclerospora sorghi]
MAQTPTTYLDIIDDDEVGGDIGKDTELILDIGSNCVRSMNAEYNECGIQVKASPGSQLCDEALGCHDPKAARKLYDDQKNMLNRQLIHKHWAHSMNILFGSLERETRRIKRDKRVPCRPRLNWAIEDRVVVEYKHIKLPFFSRRSKILRIGFERVFFSMAQTPTTYLDIINDGEVGGDIGKDTELILDIGSNCVRSMNAEYNECGVQ